MMLSRGVSQLMIRRVATAVGSAIACLSAPPRPAARVPRAKIAQS